MRERREPLFFAASTLLLLAGGIGWVTGSSPAAEACWYTATVLGLVASGAWTFGAIRRRQSSVDVIADPVYYWRSRDDGERSITQRRLELKALTDRLDAVEQVRAFLARHEDAVARRRYDESLVGDDLRLYLNMFDEAGPEWQALFLDRVNALLDTAPDDIYDALMAIDRLKWHLVRRRMARRTR